MNRSTQNPLTTIYGDPARQRRSDPNFDRDEYDQRVRQAYAMGKTAPLAQLRAEQDRARRR